MAKEKLECSFCGRKKPETNLLIAGIDAHICDKCIEQANGIVVDADQTYHTLHRRFQYRLLFEHFVPQHYAVVDGVDVSKHCRDHFRHKTKHEGGKLL